MSLRRNSGAMKSPAGREGFFEKSLLVHEAS